MVDWRMACMYPSLVGPPAADYIPGRTRRPVPTARARGMRALVSRARQPDPPAAPASSSRALFQHIHRRGWRARLLLRMCIPAKVAAEIETWQLRRAFMESGSMACVFVKGDTKVYLMTPFFTQCIVVTESYVYRAVLLTQKRLFTTSL